MNQLKNKFSIVYTIDLRFIDYFLVSITSLIKNNLNLNLYFYIICTKEDKNYINNIIDNNLYINNYSLLTLDDNLLIDLKTSNHFTVVNYFRLLIDKLVYENQVLYVDSDTFFVNSIQDLVNINLDSFYLAAIENPNYYNKSKINLNSNIPYFNSGILLLNLDLIRRDNIFVKAITFAKNNPTSIIYPDQCSLNSVVNGNFILLNPKYNLQTIFFKDISNINASIYTKKKIKDAINSPIIIHFTGKYKPLYFAFQHPYLKEYKLFIKNNINLKIKKKFDLIFIFKICINLEFIKNRFLNIFLNHKNNCY